MSSERDQVSPPLTRRQLRELHSATTAPAQAVPVLAEPVAPALPATRRPVADVDTAPVRRVDPDPPTVPGHARPAGGRHPHAPRRAGRAGVLLALVAATVVVPVAQQAAADGGVLAQVAAAGTLPSTLSALTATPLSVQAPASLVGSSDSIAARDVDTVSRSVERLALLEGCDGEAKQNGANGQLPQSDLCVLWDGRTEVRADYAVALAALNTAYVARFGSTICFSSGYRTLAEQRVLKSTKWGLTASPGKSNHGWGLAVDLCPRETAGERWAWLNENGPTYGVVNPEWARPGGSGPYERWHWEYLPGVKADGEYYGS